MQLLRTLAEGDQATDMLNLTAEPQRSQDAEAITALACDPVRRRPSEGAGRRT